MTTDADWRIRHGFDKAPDSTGLGPDWPSPADRERDKFRRGVHTRDVTVAVSNDDGSEVGASAAVTTEELLLELKAIRIGIQLMLAEFNSRQLADLRELALGE